jgi:exonuclease VII small subunit
VIPLQSATKLIGDFHDGLQAVQNMDGILRSLSQVAELLDGAAAALSPVPVVGEIAELFEAGVLEPATATLNDVTILFNQVNSDVVKPALEVLSDLRTGLQDVTTVVSDATVSVPQYLNTIQVLSYLLDIAQPLTNVLQGTEPSQRLATVVSTLETVRDDVGKALKPFADGLLAIQSAIQPLANALQAAYSAMGSAAEKAISDLQSAGNLLMPISSGFQKVLDAVAPVRWALDALDCIMNRIVMPVVNWVLEVTGLKSLVAGAQDKVLAWIGVQSVLQAVQNSVSPSGLQSTGSSVNTSAGVASAAAFDAFSNALGEYRTNRSAALKNSVFALISAITGTPVDFHQETTSMPPWPQPPTLSEPSAAVKAAASAAPLMMLVRTSAPSLQISGVQPQMAVSAIHSQVASSGQVAPLSLLSIANAQSPPQLPAIDPSKWPQSAAFAKDVSDAVGSVTALSTAMGTLRTSLAAFQQSLILPAQFWAQVAALHTSFKTCDDLANLLSEFKLGFVDTLIQPLAAILKTQLADIQDVTTSTPKLQAAVATLSTAAQGVLAQMPPVTVIETAVHRMDGWVLGLQQLVATMETGYSLAKGDTSLLDKGRAQIEGNAQALGDRLESLAGSVQQLSKCVAGLQQNLDTYSEQLNDISAYSTTIATKSLPSIQHVAAILGKIDAIFDPLSSLLAAEQCVDSSIPKTSAQIAVNGFQVAAQAAAVPAPQSFISMLENFSNQILPLGQIDSAVRKATATITTETISAFQTGAQTIAAQLTTLSKALQQTKTYSFMDPQTGERYETPNDLVDQNFVDNALNAIKSGPVPPG